MTKGRIAASMMCANLVDIKEVIELFESEHVEYLHIDIMDGSFVPNLGLGVDYIRALREMTSIPLDLHLMVERPEEKLRWLGIQENDNIIIHYESTRQLQKVLEEAKQYQCRVLLALNPGTPIYCVEEVLDYIDGISILTVNPGFAGQKIVKSCIRKVEKLKKYLAEQGYSHLLLEVDGNISFAHAKLFKNMGAELFVAGTSSIFGNQGIKKEDIRRFRDCIE